MRTSLAFALVLSLTAAASAGIVTPVVVNAGPAPGAPGLTVFQVYLTVPDLVQPDPGIGNKITGFDCRFDGDMNQVWAWGSVQTPLMDTLDLYDQDQIPPTLKIFTQQHKDRDTHVVWHVQPWDGGSAELLWVDPMPTAEENAPGMPANPTGASEGTGTWLAGKEGTVITDLPLGFVPAVQGTNVHLAQIVIPDASSGGVTVTGLLSMAEWQWSKTSVDPDPEVWEWLLTGLYSEETVSFLVPEPATLGLLTVGACGLFLRRRRR